MIEEILTAQATIQAAEIQKWGNIWAALLGGAAIGLGVLASWYTSLRLQRDDRLIETKRDVYLELVESYSNIVLELQMTPSDVIKRYPKLEESFLNFSVRADKAIFICQTNTKKEIVSFLKDFAETSNSILVKILGVRDLAKDLEDLSSQHEKIMKRFNDAVDVLEGIKMEDPGSEKIPTILEYFQSQIDLSKKHMPLITQKEAELKENLDELHLYIENLISSMADQVAPVVHLLRKELGTTTDIELDLKINSQFKQT